MGAPVKALLLATAIAASAGAFASRLDPEKVVADCQSRRCRSEEQSDHHDLVILGTSGQSRLILILPVVRMKKGQLLVSVGRIIECVDVKG